MGSLVRSGYVILACLGAFLLLPLSVGGQELSARSDTDWHYRVRPGDNIWTVSRRLLSDWHRWPDVQSHNGIVRPRSIPPGTMLAIPRDWLRLRSGPATVTAIGGSAWMEQSSREPLVVGQTIEAGAIISTAAQSSVQLGFVDGSTIRLLEETEIMLERVDGYEGTESVDVLVHLEQGRLEIKVDGTTDQDSRFLFRSRALISAVRGTRLRTGLLEDGSRGTTEVIMGSVDTTGASVSMGTSVVLSAGLGTAADVGGEPEPPTPLLPAPVPVDPDGGWTSLPVEIAFEPLSGAVAYRVLVADASMPNLPILDVSSPDPIINLGNLADGHYYFRARAVASNDIEGFDAEWKGTVDARPLSPRLLGPGEDEIIRESRAEFRWEQVEEATGYRLQIAADATFSKPYIDIETEALSHEIQGIRHGQSHWRVLARSGEETGPASPSRQLAFIEPAAPPVITSTDMDVDAGMIHVSPVVPGRNYRFQFARDPDFKAVVLERMSENSSLSLAGIKPGHYHVRAQVIESDGHAGAFGPAESIEIEPWPYWPLIPLAALLLLL